MRHIVIGGGIFAAVLLFCLWSGHYVTQAVKSAEESLVQAYDLAEKEDTDAALQAVEAASSCWDDHSDYFGTVLRHDEIDSVVGEFARLRITIRSGDNDEFLPTCAALLATLRHIREMEWPYFYNIF